MTLADRLKLARGSLGYSQKEMAKNASVSVQMWQTYESGKSVPGGNVFEALARMGFNVNWLLTGDGEMRQDESAAVWQNTSVPEIGERIREIRGDTQLWVLAAKFRVSEETLAEYEAESCQPDINFLADLCREYKINPAWLLIGLGPKQIDNVVYKNEDVEVIATLDEKILRDVLQHIQDSYNQFIEEGSQDESLFHNLVGMSGLIAYCYEDEINNNDSSKSSKRKTTKVKRLVGLINTAKK